MQTYDLHDQFPYVGVEALFRSRAGYTEAKNGVAIALWDANEGARSCTIVTKNIGGGDDVTSSGCGDFICSIRRKEFDISEGLIVAKYLIWLQFRSFGMLLDRNGASPSIAHDL